MLIFILDVLHPPHCKLAVMDWCHRMRFSVTSLDIISQSCPAQEKTYASCFNMKLRPQISMWMIHWNIENNTRNMDSLPPPFLHEHTLSPIHKHFLSSAVCVMNYKQLFIWNCLSHFQNMILFPVCLFESLKPISSPGRDSQHRARLLGREDADSLGRHDQRHIQFVQLYRLR